MKYRELLEKYRAGELSEQETAALEADIEKHESIMDYLLENTEPEGIPMAEIPEWSTDSSKDFVKTVNRSIRRAFVMAGAVTAAVVLALVLLLPQGVSLFFYDPTEVVGVSRYGAETNKMSLDLSVYSELYLPGKFRDTVYADAQGYGEYAITIPQTTSATGIFTAVAGRLERGTLTLYDPNLLNTPFANAFVYPEGANVGHHGAGAAGSAEDALRKLGTLDEKGTYRAYFSLSKLMDYDEFYGWYYELFENGADIWCGVYTNCGGCVGFSPVHSGNLMDWNREKYPMLRILDSRSSVESLQAVATDADLMQLHFTSMLRYMRDNSAAQKMFCVNGEDWDGMIDYVERNGLQLFGFCITADLQTIMEIACRSTVSYVYTQPAN